LTRWLSVKRLLAATLLVFSLTSLYCGITKSLNVLLIANIINGCAAASVVPLGLMTIGKHFDPEFRGRAVGLFFSSSFISALLGVLASGTIHWSFLFIIPFILGIITIIILLLIRPPGIGLPDGRLINYAKALADRDVLRIFTFIFFMSFLYHGVYKWYGVYLDREYHLSQAMVSSLILVTSVSGAFGQNFGGAMTDLKGRFFSIELGLGVLGVSTVLLAGHYPVFCVAIILAMISAGWTVGHNGVSTVLTDFPDKYRAELASLNSSVRFLSGGLGFYLSGFLIQKSFPLNFFVVGVLILALVPLIRYFLVRSSTSGIHPEVEPKRI
jgi:predicted MFS family arabinose efflux permease